MDAGERCHRGAERHETKRPHADRLVGHVPIDADQHARADRGAETQGNVEKAELAVQRLGRFGLGHAERVEIGGEHRFLLPPFVRVLLA